MTVDVPAAFADAVSGLLIDQGALGLETEDDETRAVPGRALAPTGRAAVTGTFSRAQGLEARISAAISKGHFQDIEVVWSDLFAEDWNAIFRAHWKPFRCGKLVWVCPSWERDSFLCERVFAGPQPIVLYLDAGMAFGTGTHETTQLCIEKIESLGEMNSFLDVGTGTGILAIAALKLGARRAKGTDIDPVAVATSIENAAANGVAKNFRANDDLPNVEKHDVVAANILAGALIELADAISAAVAPGGALFLSGVLAEQERPVVAAYVKRGLKHVGTATKNGWVRIDLRA